MDNQNFDTAVAAMARQQAQRLRDLGFGSAACEVESLLGTGDLAAEEG